MRFMNRVPGAVASRKRGETACGEPRRGAAMGYAARACEDGGPIRNRGRRTGALRRCRESSGIRVSRWPGRLSSGQVFLFADWRWCLAAADTLEAVIAGAARRNFSLRAPRSASLRSGRCRCGHCALAIRSLLSGNIPAGQRLSRRAPRPGGAFAQHLPMSGSQRNAGEVPGHLQGASCRIIKE
jgi:hypothetical protein